MNEGQLNKQSKNKHLIIILSILGCIILALVVSIVVIKINSPAQPEETVAEEEEEEDDELYWEGMSEEELTEAKLIEKSKQIDAEVKQLLEENPVNVNKINELYNEAIELAKQSNRPDYVLIFNLDRKDNLVSKGLNKEALDAMLTMDFASYSEPNQYRLYSEIIKLAEATNDKETVSKYETLRKGVEAAYQADYNATAEAAARDDSFDPGIGGEEEDE